MKMIYKTIAIVLALMVAGCAPSSRITSSWKSPEATPKQFDKIMVLGLINEPDRTIREKMEIDLVNKLNSIGYNAFCSCNEFNPKEFENMNEEQAINKIKKSGADAVLTVVLLDKEKERYYVPGRVYYSPYVIYHRRFWGYYVTLYDRVYSPGYYSSDTKYFWESNLYELTNDKKLIYSVQTSSFDPVSTNNLADEYSSIIVNDLVKNNVLTTKRGF